MGQAAMLMMGIGSLLNVGASYNDAKTKRAQLGAQADIARINAGLAEKTAQATLQRGEREQQASRLQAAQLKSRQRAVMAANGIDLGSDSAVNILTSTDVLSEVDANTIAANSVRSAWGYRMQATGFENQARMADASRKGINPGAAAFTSLLGSGAQVAASWYSMDQAGMFSDTGGGDINFTNTSSSTTWKT